jgi:ABC-type nitrate/sulfonate/bicarbonate transport system permease component
MGQDAMIVGDRGRRLVRALVTVAVLAVLYGIASEVGSRHLPRRIWVGVHFVEDVELLPTYASLAEELVFLLRSGLLAQSLAVSTGRVLAGLATGAAVGVPLGFLMAEVRLARWAIEPWATFFRFTPALALLPLYVLWIGPGEGTKIALIATAVAIVMLEGAYAGARGVSPVHLDAGAALGASRALVFRRIVLPAALPAIVVSVRIAVGLAWVTIVVAELIAPEMPSLGYLLALSGAYPRVPAMAIGLATVGLAVFVSDVAVLAAYGRVTRWMRRRDG